jgi:hypothetical protein
MAEQVTGIDAQVLANTGGINLADSAVHAPRVDSGIRTSSLISSTRRRL